jgi:hypothetical protein
MTHDPRLTEKEFWRNYQHRRIGGERGGSTLGHSAGKEVRSMTGACKASSEIVNDYLRLFVNRLAYTLQSMRPHLASGRHYCFRPTDRDTGAALPLTKEIIKQHLEGELTVGLYAINPSTQRCKWGAIDADYKNAMEDLLKLQYYLWQDSVEPALEMSKRGGHLGFSSRLHCWPRNAGSTFTIWLRG